SRGEIEGASQSESEGGRGYTHAVAEEPGTGAGEAIAESVGRAKQGGAPKYHEKLAEQAKLFVRDRLRLLLDDEDTFSEEGLLVNALAGDLPADGVVTGVGQVTGRPVAVMANDPTAKAGSWGPHTDEKIISIVELARKRMRAVADLAESAGARIP